MIQQETYTLFDPQNMDSTVLPDTKGTYIVVLRSNLSLPTSSKLKDFPLRLTPINWDGKELNVIYIGKSSTSLRKRDYRQHFYGNAGSSTLRKSLGCLMGFSQIPRDPNNPNNGKSKYSESDEATLTEWMLKSLLILFYPNETPEGIEKELIRKYNPPLNLANNTATVNIEYRQALSELRSGRIPQKTLGYTPAFPRCPHCGIELIISDELKYDKKIQCLSCNSIIDNPIYQEKRHSRLKEREIQAEKRRKNKRIVKIIFYSFIVCYVIFKSVSENTNTNTNQTSTPSSTQMIYGVQHYLKNYYLKDPDSYKSMNWGPSGIYNKDKNTYFMMHQYRAKNSFGGYVIEEKMFVLNSTGNVIDIKEDINELINDN